MGSALPIAPARINAKSDIQINGYVIPKGTPVQMNLYGLHHDKEHWKDPDNYRPDRFIENGTLKFDEWFQPFGYGKRRCVGDAYAKAAVILFLANFLNQFSFEKVG